MTACGRHLSILRSSSELHARPGRYRPPPVGFVTPPPTCRCASTPAGPLDPTSASEVPPRKSRSALVVLHHLDGFLRATVAGLLHPAADLGFAAFGAVPTRDHRCRWTAPSPVLMLPLPAAPRAVCDLPRDAVSYPSEDAPSPQPHHVAVAVAPLLFRQLRGFAPWTGPVRFRRRCRWRSARSSLGFVPLRGLRRSVPTVRYTAGDPPEGWLHVAVARDMWRPSGSVRSGDSREPVPSQHRRAAGSRRPPWGL